MDKGKIIILAIESSCDETAAAVIGVENGKPTILSNVISSQIDLHAKTGGVVPEVASRAHMEAIIPAIEEALIKSKVRDKKAVEKTTDFRLQTSNYSEAVAQLQNITHVAVTAGPGLVGSLLVGFNAAKSIAYARNLPIIPINHIEGHIYSAWPSREISNSEFLISNQIPISNEAIKQFGNEAIFPLISLTVSGGHTSLTLIKDHLKYESIGNTIDDAAGEAFDKVAKLLGLGYPGGPEVSKLAKEFRNKFMHLSIAQFDNLKKEKLSNIAIKQYSNEKPNGFSFPRPIINDGTFNFSFSGLKTAVLTKVKNLTKDGYELTESDKEEICAAFEDAAVDVLCTKTMRAAEKYRPKGIILAGGVSANNRLQDELKNRIEDYNSEATAEHRMNFYLPPKDMTGDNAAMIGLAAYYHILNGDISTWDKIKVDSNMELE